MIKKIISGGQTGVDTLALHAAQLVGFSTGGWIPKDFRREDKNGENVADEYGLKEHPQWNYIGRTKQNIDDSDGTLLLWLSVGSTGSKATLKYCKTINKSCFIVNPFDIDQDAVETIARIRKWIKDNQITVLNVAGTRGSHLTVARKEATVGQFLYKLCINLHTSDESD